MEPASHQPEAPTLQRRERLLPGVGAESIDAYPPTLAHKFLGQSSDTRPQSKEQRRNFAAQIMEQLSYSTPSERALGVGWGSLAVLALKTSLTAAANAEIGAALLCGAVTALGAGMSFCRFTGRL